MNGVHRITWNDLSDYWFTNLWDGDSVYINSKLYRYISFRIRGDIGGEDFTIWLHDNINEASFAITDYANVTASWQQVDIPLKDFVAKGLDITHLKSVVFDFSVVPSGTIWIDDIELRGFQHPPIL